LTVLFVIAGDGVARADRRVALVVGNATYKTNAMSLTNPANDAQDVTSALKDLGFDVLSVANVNKRDMDVALGKFARMATGADSALFYYAGHGIQYQGRNYLVPVDAVLEDEISVRYEMTAIDDIRDALDRAEGVKIMILDACRNNPLADRMRKSGGSRAIGGDRGLARIDRAQGSIIVYATSADQIAEDGVGRNSPFTSAMLKRIQEPGLEIEMMFRRVSADVATQTGGRQRPETFVSLQSEYYLNQNDLIAWDKMKDHADVAGLRDFIKKFPSSPQTGVARDRIDQLEREAQQRVANAVGPRPPQPTPSPPGGSPRTDAIVKEQAPPPQQQALVIDKGPQAARSGPGVVIRFTEPLTSGPVPVNGQSIEKLAASTPLFPPFDGLPDNVWKRDCSSCHKWTQGTLCKQGQTYVANPATALRNQHPYGGPFKVALMEWARTDCQ
jgi:hypothetical protein